MCYEAELSKGYEEVVEEEDKATYLLQADLAAAEEVKKWHPNVNFPLQGKMKKILLGQFFVFDARSYLHGGGPGKSSITD